MKFRVLILTLSVFAYCGKNTEVKYITGENGQPGAIIPANANGATANFDGQLIFNVAADSMQDPVDITIQKIPAPAAQNEIVPIASAYEFGPEGTEFVHGNQASFCYNPEQLKAKGLSENTMQVYYLDPDGALQSIGGDVDTVNHCVTASIEHFSTYVAAAYTTLAGGNSAPAITGTNWLPTTPIAGLPLRIRVTIADFDVAHNQGAIASAFVRYRMVGEATGSNFPHVLALIPDTADTSGQKFYATIPANHVTLAGIEYRLDATDNFGAEKQLPSSTSTAKSKRTVTKTVNTSTPLKLSVTALNISSGFAKDIVVQGKDTGGKWRTLEPDSVVVGGAVGSTARWQPGSFRFVAGATGVGTITANVGAYSISAPITVLNGVIQKIEILNTAGVIITSPILVNLGEVISLDALGYDAYGNQILITPVFAATGDVGVITPAGLFNASASPANGSITATLAGLTDSVPVYVAVPTYSVGGTVSGLTAGTLVLQNNGGDDLSVGVNGSFVFATRLNDNTAYNVTIATQPAGLYCRLTNRQGVINAASTSAIGVACSTQFPGDEDIAHNWIKASYCDFKARCPRPDSDFAKIYSASDSQNSLYTLSGRGDYWLIRKFSASGAEDVSYWSKEFFDESGLAPEGGMADGTDRTAVGIAVDSSDNVYYLENQIITAAQFTTNKNVLRKYSRDGSLVWEKTISAQLASALIVSNTYVYIACEESSLISPTSAKDWLIRKLDLDGIEQFGSWPVAGGGEGFDFVFSLATDTSGNIYVSYQNPTQSFQISKILFGGSLDSGFVQPSLPGIMTGLRIDSSNSIYATGTFLADATRVWVKKFNSMGVEVTTGWNKEFPNFVGLGQPQIILDSSGSLIFAYAADLDWKFRRFDPNGNSDTNWDRTIDLFNRNGQDLIFWMTIDSADSVLVGGYSNSDYLIKKYLP